MEFIKSKVTYGLGLTGAYLTVALLMTYPLARYFGSFVAADSGDGAQSVWNLWWTKFSLFGLGHSLFSSEYQFYPDGANLVFNSIPKVLAAIGIPLQYLFGLTAAYNIVFLFTFVGSALAAYLLILHFSGERLPAFLGGAFFAFCPFRWAQWSHLALLSTMMVPIYILLLVKGKEALYDRERRAWVFFGFAGVALALQSYDTEHYTIYLLLFSGMYLLYNLVLSPSRASLKRWSLLAAGQSLSVLVAVLLFLPVLLAANREVAGTGDFVRFPIRETASGADLLSFIVPDASSSYLGGAFAAISGHFLIAETTFLGWTVLVLALVGVWRYRKNPQVWFWTIAALVFAALAIGPYLVIYGEMKHVAGPFLLLQKIPLLNSTRTPGRFSLMVMLSLSVLAAFGIKAILSWLNRPILRRLLVPVLATGVLALTFVEYKPTVRLTSIKAPPVYEEIAKSDIPGPVVTVPLGWLAGVNESGHKLRAFSQFYQPVHRRPLISGEATRAPKEQGIEGSYVPVLDFLAEPALEPSDLDKNEAAVSRVMEKYQFAFIVVHKKAPDYYLGGRFRQDAIFDQQTLAKLDDYITSFLPMEKFQETDEYVAYRRT